MRGGIGVRSSQLAIAVACIAAGVLILLIAVHTTPIADDYADIAVIGHEGAFQYLHSFWLVLTDRYSDAAFMVVMIKLFGATAIHIATPLLISALFSCCVAAARRIGRSGHSRWEAGTVAGVAAVAIASATPSIFDTLGWFNAVAIYLTGVVAAAGTVAWMARIATLESIPKPLHLAVGFIIGFAAAGFTELIGIVITLGSFLAVANVRAICPPGPRRRAIGRVYAAIAAGAAAGVVVILVGPGSRARLKYQHGGFDFSRLADAIRANLPWVGAFRWDLLACAAAGLLVFNLRSASSEFGFVTSPIIRAEQLRQTALRARSTSIRRELALHRDSILVTPAPLIILDTSAFDFTFEHLQQYVWVRESVRQCYAIPASTTLRVNPSPPRYYCMDRITVPWAGVESCQELSATARADRKRAAHRARR